MNNNYFEKIITLHSFSCVQLIILIIIFFKYIHIVSSTPTVIECPILKPRLDQNLKIDNFISIGLSGSGTQRLVQNTAMAQVSCIKYFDWIEENKNFKNKNITFKCTTNGWKEDSGVKFDKLKCHLICGTTTVRNMKDSIRNENQLDWPWHVGIFKQNQHICDGSLISPFGHEFLLILTAAHCFKSNSLKNPHLFKIGIGVTERSIDENKITTGNNTETFQIFNVETIEIHPNYTKINFENILNDIALLKTNIPIKLTDYSLPICLPTKSNYNNNDGKNIGRITEANVTGTINGAKPQMSNYHSVIVSILPRKECDDISKNKLLPSQFCAGKWNDKTTCIFNSDGVGLVSPGNENQEDDSKPFTIQGVGSIGRKNGIIFCGYLYTRVYSFMDWINSTSHKLLVYHKLRTPKIEFNKSNEYIPSTISPNYFESNTAIISQVHNTETTKMHEHNLYIIPIFVVTIILILTIGTTIFCWKIYMYRQTKFSKQEVEEFLNGCKNVRKGSHSNFINECIQTLPYDTEYEIIESDLKIDQTSILGIGTYGVVFNGIYQDKPVAVKTLKAGAEKEYLIALLSELKVMIYLKNHLNLVSVIGANTKLIQRGILYIVVDLCPLGNLIKYLQKNRDSFESDYLEGIIQTVELRNIDNNGRGRLSISHLFRWAYQISAAMEYLEIKKVVHGDLAARNVFLTENLNAKVGDFGLSRQLFDHMEYVKTHQEPLPWRWMAPESLQMLHFSSKSDVWSFGITLWEMFTLGDLPYPGLSYTVDFPIRISEGLRLYKPPYADCQIYELMQSCWNHTPQDRPTFPQIKITLLDVLNRHSNLEEYTDLEFT